MSLGSLGDSQGYESVPMYIRARVGGWRRDICPGIDMS